MSDRRLTKRFIDSLAPSAGETFHWDGAVPGFGLRVYPSGAKAFFVQYRSGRRTRRLALGAYGVLTVDEARDRARKALVEVSDGGDPSLARRQARRAATVAELCDRFDAEHVAVRCKPSTAEEYRRTIRALIKPKFGRHRVADVSRADMAQLHHAMRATPYQANRVLAMLSKLFNMAEAWGLRADGTNPCRHVRKYPERRRERFLSPEEMARLGRELDAADAEGGEIRFAVAAIRLLLLTGCRRGEIQTLKWSHVRLDRLDLPDSKTGARTVYIGPAARAVLQGIPRDPANEYVIRGRVPGRYQVNLCKAWRRIRERAGLGDVRLHDLRHTFASGAVALGEGLPMIGKLLGHRQVQTTARYAHLADRPVQDAAARVSGAIAAALGGGSARRHSASEAPLAA